MEIQEILDELQFCNGKFPRQALQEAIARREEVTPFLLKILEDVGRDTEILNQEEYMAHVFAMYLLAQFREKQAYPLIVALLSVPDEIIMESLGEMVTEDMHRILASVAYGDTGLIKSLVQNEKINEFIRGAALQTLTTQMVLGEITRDELLAYYQSLFREGLEQENSHVWDSLVSYCSDLYPEELIEYIREAYGKRLVNPGYISLKNVEETLKRSKDAVLKELYSRQEHSYIEDVITEIGWWACFNSSPSETTNTRNYQPEYVVKPPPAVAQKKVGRNEPCPYGSGKKYKKCCGANK
jgi:hypothetical protein